MTTKRVDQGGGDSGLWQQFYEAIKRVEVIGGAEVKSLTVPEMCVELLRTPKDGLQLKAESNSDFRSFKEWAVFVGDNTVCQGRGSFKEVSRCEEVKKRLFEEIGKMGVGVRRD
jgi:hypothetical protein